jgi:amino acid transporter/nucleotide-binding universal stress UspA family protein
MEIRLSREMRLLDITMIGVGAMIGAGIFVLTGIAAGVAGPALLVAFALNGIIALLTAMAYAELGSAFHDAGGGYLWVKSSLPDPSGFLSGWMSWFAHAVACSLYALGFGAYFAQVLKAAAVPAFTFLGLGVDKWLAALAVLAFAAINVRGAAETGKAGNVVTIAKLAIIAVFIVAGVWVMLGRPEWPVAFTPFFSRGWGGVFAAMGLTFIAFEGYEIIAQTSEEVEDPKRNVPRATFLSLVIVVPIYLLVAVAAIGASQPPAGETITAFLGREKELALVSVANQVIAGGGAVILVAGLLSTLSALNATIYSSSRVAFAMARDANLPETVGRVHPRRATPHVAIAVSTVIIVVMALALPIEQVAAATDVMFLLLFTQVNLAVIRLRRQRPDLARGFRVPWMPVVPIVAMAAMVALTVVLLVQYPQALLATAGWIAVGGFVYYRYSRRHEVAFEERTQWMERLERSEYRVLAAISSPATLPSLMEAAIALTTYHGGELTVVTVVEVPHGETLLAGRRRTEPFEPILEEAVRYAAARGVTARPVLKLARRVSHGILETVREESCNFLVLGRPRAATWLERLMASIVERVLQHAPCRVGVVAGAIDPAGVRRVVVPVTGGANPRLATALAPAFAARFAAPLRAITVVAADADAATAEQLTADARAALEDAGVAGEPQLIRAADPAAAVAATVAPGDLVLIGAPSTDPVAALLGDTVPGTLVARRRNPVIIVRDLPPERTRPFTRFFLEGRFRAHGQPIRAAAR